MFVTNSTTPETLSTLGGLAIGIPGELRGWEMLHKRHGKLPWKKLFEPAIHMARNGFNVTVDLAMAISECKSLQICDMTRPEISVDESMILADPLWAEVYAPNGTILTEGDIAYRKVICASFVVRHSHLTVVFPPAVCQYS